MDKHTILVTSSIKPTPGGGVGNVEYQLIESLKKLGYKVDEFFPKLPSMFLTDLLFGIFLQDPYTNYVVNSHTNISWWDKDAIRVFHGCTAKGEEVANSEGDRVLKKGLYFTINKWMEKSCVNNNYCIAVSQYVADALVKYYGADPKKVAVVHNGVDTDKFYPCKTCGIELREENHIPKNAFVVSWVGGFEFNKGIYYLKEVIDKCAENKNIYFIVRNSTRVEIPEEHKWLMHTPHVIYSSHGGEMAEFYNTSDLFLHTATYDPMPLSVLEAMSCTKPVICANSGGHAEVVQTGLNGYVVDDYKDTKTMAETIIWLSKNKKVVKELGRFARKRILKSFTAAKMVDEYIKVFKKFTKMREQDV